MPKIGGCYQVPIKNSARRTLVTLSFTVNPQGVDTINETPVWHYVVQYNSPAIKNTFVKLLMLRQMYGKFHPFIICGLVSNILFTTPQNTSNMATNILAVWTKIKLPPEHQIRWWLRLFQVTCADSDEWWSFILHHQSYTDLWRKIKTRFTLVTDIKSCCFIYLLWWSCRAYIATRKYCRHWSKLCCIWSERLELDEGKMMHPVV